MAAMRGEPVKYVRLRAAEHLVYYEGERIGQVLRVNAYLNGPFWRPTNALGVRGPLFCRRWEAGRWLLTGEGEGM